MVSGDYRVRTRRTANAEDPLSPRRDRRVLKCGYGPTLLLLRHYERKHRVCRQLFGWAFPVSTDVHHRHIRSQKANLFDRKTDLCFLVDRVEYLLVRGLDRGAALDVHAVDDDVISIVGKRLGEESSAFCVPTVLHLLDGLTHRGFVSRVIVLRVRVDA